MLVLNAVFCVHSLATSVTMNC